MQRYGFALLLACALVPPSAFAAQVCAPGDSAADVNEAFRLEFERRTTEFTKTSESQTQALNAIVARLDERQAWTSEQKLKVLQSMAESATFTKEEALKSGLQTRLEKHLRAMETATGEALCTHAREALSLFSQGQASNERQWRFMRETLMASEAAAKAR